MPCRASILLFNVGIGVSAILDSGHARRSEFAGEERILSGCRDSSQHYNHEIRLSAITHLQLPNVAVESLLAFFVSKTDSGPDLGLPLHSLEHDFGVKTER